jgi:hypothetical protein
MLQILINLNVISLHDLSSKIEFDPRIGWRAEDGITTHGAPYAEPQWRRADGSPPALRLPIHKTCLEPGGHSGRTTQPNQQLGCRVDHRYSGGRTARVQTNIRSTVSQLGILEGM